MSTTPRGQCQCTGECGWARCIARHVPTSRCTAVHGQPHPVTGVHVTLMTPPGGRRRMCNGCRFAAETRIYQRARIRDRLTSSQQGMTSLFEGGPR